MKDEEERRRQEEEVHRQAQEALEREREEEEAVREDNWKKSFFPRSAGGNDASVPEGVQSSSTGFRLDMGRVTGAAQKAAELEPDMAKWTPRARPKDAPKQSARYQSDFKALPEDVLECSLCHVVMCASRLSMLSHCQIRGIFGYGPR